MAIIYPARGRGAWSSMGGTLSSDGTTKGPFFRAPEGSMPMPGRAAFDAIEAGDDVSINDYAVWRGVIAIQEYIGVEADGLFGPATGRALQVWQERNALKPDGVFGQATAKRFWRPMAIKAARDYGSQKPEVLERMLLGHTAHESLWCQAAVGGSTPKDLGLNQINGDAHPILSPNFRLDPKTSLPWTADFVNDNLRYFSYREDDAIAAYNLGRGGASLWVRAGRPDVWHKSSTVTIYVRDYIDSVKAASL